MKQAPVGLGVFVAYEKMIPGGYEALIEQAPSLGISWIAPRGGQKGRDPSWSSQRAKELIKKSEGIVSWYPWIYNVPDAVTIEATLYRSFMDEGAAGIILDAEDAYCRNNANGRSPANIAAVLMELLNKSMPDVWKAHCPYSYVLYHSDFPYKAFGDGCDAIMDQLYWTEFNDKGFQKHADAVDAQWKKTNGSYGTVRAPIGVTYGRGDLKGGTQPQGDLVVDDVRKFLDRYLTNGTAGFASLYSFEVAHEGVLDLLRSRVSTSYTPNEASPEVEEQYQMSMPELLYTPTMLRK